MSKRLASRPPRKDPPRTEALGTTRKPGPARAPRPALAASEKVEGEVDAFLSALDHPAKATLKAVRSVVLGAHASITEGIKWNAPSFRTTEWFATFHLRSKLGVQLILHRGAKVRDDQIDRVPDPECLLTWLGKDRASVTVSDLQQVTRQKPALAALVRRWIKDV